MNITISGYGKMGKTLKEYIDLTDHTVSDVVDKNYINGLNTFDEIKNLPDCIIDFSHPLMLEDLLSYAHKNRIPLVICTTGYTKTQEQKINQASKEIPILYAKNTSLGIAVIDRILPDLVHTLKQFDIEIIEKHHREKIDAPSGTAKQFAKTITDHRSLNLVYQRYENPKRNENDLSIHSIRGGTIFGEHTILFAHDDEMIEIKHTALSKKIFAKGALNAALFIVNQKNGIYQMKDIL